MRDFLFAWKSYVMIDKPWLMPIFLFTLSILLSFVTWIRERIIKKSAQQRS